MPSVLKNFLIGVGLDTEDYDKGAKRVESSLGRMRSLVGFTGAAITGAFAAVGAAAIGAGQRVDRLNLEFEKFRTSPQYIYDYGNAIRALGGSADEATAAINVAESALESFRQTGQLPGLDDLAMAGVDVNALTQTDTGRDFMRELARQMPGLTKGQQFRVQETLGLSNAVMRSLRGGVDQLDQAVARAHDLAGNFESATEAARDFNKELAELGTRMEGIGNALAEKVLPGFTGVLQSMGGFLDKHQEQINAALDVAGENPGATALATGGGAATAAGVALRGIGLRSLGLGLTRFVGTPAMVAGSALMAYDSAKDWDWGDWWDESKSSARDSWRSLTRQNDLSDLPDAPYGPAVPQVGPGGALRRQEPDTVAPDVRGPVSPWSPDDFMPTTPHSGMVEHPIYAGGEVSNSEAASASPDVIMVQAQRQQAEKPAAPQRVEVQNHLDVKMEVDGRALDKRITEVVERRERNTTDDLISSVNR